MSPRCPFSPELVFYRPHPFDMMSFRRSLLIRLVLKSRLYLYWVFRRRSQITTWPQKYQPLHAFQIKTWPQVDQAIQERSMHTSVYYFLFCTLKNNTAIASPCFLCTLAGVGSINDAFRFVSSTFFLCCRFCRVLRRWTGTWRWTSTRRTRKMTR